MPDDSDIFQCGVKYHSAAVLDRVHTRKRVRKDAIIPTSATEKCDDGEARLRRYMKRLHGGFRYGNEVLRLGQFQLEFISIISHMVAQNIVGDAWNLIGSRLCNDFGWDIANAPQMGLGKAPRRFGKTVTIAVVMVNYCLEVEGACVSAFSTSKRTSMLVKKKVLQMLVESGYESWILRHGDEVIVMRDPQKPNARPAVMAFYPSNPRIGSIHGIFVHMMYCYSVVLSVQSMRLFITVRILIQVGVHSPPLSFVSPSCRCT